MPVLFAGAQGEWARFTNTLDALGADALRPGSVRLFKNVDSMEKSFTGTTDMWFHIRMASNNTGGATSGQDNVEVRDSGGRLIAGFEPIGNGGAGPIPWRFRMKYATNNFGGTAVDSELFEMPRFEFVTFDIHLVFSGVNNRDLSYDLYIDGLFRKNISVTSANLAYNLPNSLRLRDKYDAGPNTRPYSYFQDVIVTDSVNTIGMQLVAHNPDSAGIYTDFTGDYTDIDETGFDPVDFIDTNVAADKESWGVGTGFNIDNLVVYGLVTSTAWAGDGGTDLRDFVRVAGADYNSPDYGVTVTPDHTNTFRLTNPDNGQPWSLADIAALESGVESR